MVWHLLEQVNNMVMDYSVDQMVQDMWQLDDRGRAHTHVEVRP